MSKKLHGELVVIGAGPGGYAAAFRAADLGKNVILIDNEKKISGSSKNLYDFVHLNSLGSTQISNLISEALSKDIILSK